MPIIRQFDFDREAIRSPYLRLLYDYWIKLRGNRAAPDIHEIDPLDIPRAALPYVVLVDLEHDPFRARYRLVGTHGTQAAGWDYTGRYVDELDMPNTMVEEIHEDFLFAIQLRPMYANYEWPLRDNRGIVNVELIQLPLLQDGVVTRCFCGEHVGQDLELFADEMAPLEKSK